MWGKKGPAIGEEGKRGEKRGEEDIGEAREGWKKRGNYEATKEKGKDMRKIKCRQRGGKRGENEKGKREGKRKSRLQEVGKWTAREKMGKRGEKKGVRKGEGKKRGK